MTANKKVLSIVLAGVGACLLSFFSSRYLMEKDRTNQAVLSLVQQATARVDHIRLLGRSFIQNADQSSWQNVTQAMESLRLDLETLPRLSKQWQPEIETLNQYLNVYRSILTQLHKPAVNLKEHQVDWAS